YIYKPNVNMVEEMANMIAASRSYQSNVEVAKTSKQLLMRTLSLGE
ncbi:MAG TPA: flagellar basal body rod protein FlgC, partial [Gammaproteobacteria bacterium]|nr:flagellar basal body rod protein FlgC [Gammaproteobacteria bacterium]HEC20828.1 flagellar basal body rod protein FlgC [Gammaproteobacteria bacterium]